jgi:hypothetical protein
MLEQVTQEVIDDIKTTLEGVRVILKEEHTNRRITFHTNPRNDVPSKKALDVEYDIIRKYCNSPYLMYSDTTSYRFTLVCN